MPEPRDKDKDRDRARAKRTYDLEALDEIISDLKEASDRGVAIIVEGVRDKEALRALEICGPVIMASRRPALDLAEDAARSHDEIIMLTDWDEKGDEMAINIQRHLMCTRSRVDMETRNRLKRLVKKEIKDVESLGVYVERMRELYGDDQMPKKRSLNQKGSLQSFSPYP